MGRNWYAEAISLVSWEGQEALARIAVDVAKRHPKSVVEAAERLGIGDRVALKARCRNLYKGGRHIEAIKLWRSEMGVGLKEAKEAVEALV